MRGRKAQIQAAERATIGYARCSTEGQAINGVSIDAQEAKIASYCTAMGWHKSETIQDAGESASSLNRPGIIKVIERIKAGTIERVIVAKLDRITRSVRDLDFLINLCAKHDVALVSIGETLDTGTASGRMMVVLLGLMSQWEREIICERTAQALAHKRQAGNVYSGNAPFGYRRKGDKLIAVPAQLKAIKIAQDMHKEGASLRQIAAKLEAMKVKPNGRGKWYAQSVKYVLTSKMTTENS
jgi:DNA invertase Pin-like site-specific DNA recombinase